MSSNFNQVSFLRTQRTFPREIDDLCIQLDKAYIDTANTVNTRIIGLFPENKAVVNGEQWFLNNRKQQGFRQVYDITSTTAFNHNINISNVARFVNCWGTFTDGTKWYGLIFGNAATAISGQIVFDITSTQVEFNVSGSAPAFSRGTIVLQWISDP